MVSGLLYSSTSYSVSKLWSDHVAQTAMTITVTGRAGVCGISIHVSVPMGASHVNLCAYVSFFPTAPACGIPAQG